MLPLLGVMWGGSHGNSCYQLMPKMTSDLSSVMRSVGDLCTLVGHESRVQWENVVRPNVCHVVKGLVSGVKYLHDQGVQHYDLKGSVCIQSCILQVNECQYVEQFREFPWGSPLYHTTGIFIASYPHVNCIESSHCSWLWVALFGFN